MNPKVATIVIILFIVVGFIVEAKESKKVTSAAWLPFIWLVITASRSISQWLNLSGSIPSNGEINLEGSIADQIVLSIIMLWGIIIIFKRSDAAYRILTENKAIAIFIIYLGLTSIWSDISLVSFRRWIKLLGNVIMAAVLVTEPETLQAVKSVFRKAAYLLVPLSVLFINYIPSMGILYTPMGSKIWTGVAVMKNGLAHLSFVMSFFLIWDATNTLRQKVVVIVPRVLFDVLILIMCLWLLKGPGEYGGSSGAASKGALILGIVIMISSWLSIVKRNFRRLGLIVVMIVSLSTVLESLFGIIEYAVTLSGRDMTFTDRVPLWNTLLELGLRRPFLGYGYESFWIGARSSIEGLSQAHNGYLEIFLEGGLIATLFLVLMLVSILNKIQRHGLIDYEFAVFRLSFFAMILLANITESALARERDLLSFIFFIIAFNNNSSRIYEVTIAKFNRNSRLNSPPFMAQSVLSGS